mmetsp:Transcript_2418/g.4789  ORF Transcript_2418/g.4789 Transcript_2418/m.4789 type:complete len:204 (+) Transcript_2418:578-1189(+)
MYRRQLPPLAQARSEGPIGRGAARIRRSGNRPGRMMRGSGMLQERGAPGRGWDTLCAQKMVAAKWLLPVMSRVRRDQTLCRGYPAFELAALACHCHQMHQRQIPRVAPGQGQRWGTLRGQQTVRMRSLLPVGSKVRCALCPNSGGLEPASLALLACGAWDCGMMRGVLSIAAQGSSQVVGLWWRDGRERGISGVEQRTLYRPS